MSEEATVAGASGYPLRYDVEYPEELSRWLIFVKWLLAIPHVIILYLVQAGNLPIAALLVILFRRRYPRWWFDFLVRLLQYEYRICAYLFLLRDDFPALEEEQAVRLEVDYPESLNRWLPLVKWLLAVPHIIVLLFLFIGAFVATVVAWFAILFTRRFPRGLFDFVVGVNRWGLRVNAYAFSLFTDRYPPFSFD
jgi:hypothetical protein